MRTRAILLASAVLLTFLALPGRAPAQDTPRGRALLLVDQSVYPELQAGLQKYAEHVLKLHKIAVVPRPDDYYKMKPAEIRALLKKEYAAGNPPLVGAILAGPLPHALRGDPQEILIPAPLYYEDFDAEWVDANGDGVFEELRTDRKTNATEIWTAWWVPPARAEDTAAQAKLLKGFLDKLDRYYRGEIVGRDQMLWLAGNVMNVEICEGWTVLMKDTMKPLTQQLRIWCHIGQDEGTFRPNKRAEEFSAGDFVRAFTLQPWQHAHIIAHGNPRGWYWGATGVVAGPRGDGKPEAVLLMDFSTFKGTAANIVTTSGCSNGNFRGDYIGPAYEKAVGNLLLFSPDTCTIAYFGAASPQSTSANPGFCTEIVESLKSDGGSYLAEGYKRFRNQDYSWGLEHYFFRGGDEKILSGDPFARYRDSAPPTPEQAKAVEEKIKAGNWTVVGPG